MIDGRRFVVREQNTLFDVASREVRLGISHHPGIAQLGCVVGKVRRQVIVMVMCVHLPSELQLSQVVEAARGLGIGFCSRQRRKKHRSEDRAATVRLLVSSHLSLNARKLKNPSALERNLRFAGFKRKSIQSSRLPFQPIEILRGLRCGC